MLTFTTGDLFEAGTEAIVNTVNTVGVMGKGVALQFKRRFPDNYLAYRRACEAGQVNLGKMFVTENNELSGPRVLVNFPTKSHWKSPSRIDDIRDGLADLVRIIDERKISSIALPPLGAGNGGLDWRAVRPLIENALSGIQGTNIIVFEPVDKHFTVASAGRKRMTRGRALLMTLIEQYGLQREQTEPWETHHGASHLEVQKLMYLASLATPDIKANYQQGQYGPYSDVVRIMLQELEGSYLEGLGDGTGRVLDLNPIIVTNQGRLELESFQPTPSDAAVIDTTVRAVLNWIEGFEGPYPLELLTSTHWAETVTNSSNSEVVSEYIRGWTPRKGRLFTRDHVETAVKQLAIKGITS